LSLPLSCPVRGCTLPLAREPRAWRCANGHSFDIARSGYVNLLQPQDRRSTTAGDAPAAIEARARLLAGGVGRTILEAVVRRGAASLDRDHAPVVDLGCGSGDALAALAGLRPIDGIGIDLSAFAVDHAARRFPAQTWVVANADRRLPLADSSVSLVVSLHARRNPPECARVLETGGHAVIAVPARDDLMELRASVQGAAVERDRADGVVAEHETLFDVVGRATAREHHHLQGDLLREVLRGTYRGERSSMADRVHALGAMDLTLAADIVILRKR
jgi:23S rRNA (guanine745-N1)-methyltransferase